MAPVPSVAVITGASRGIGRATALRLAEAGCTIFAVAEGTAEELAEVEAQCRSRGAADAGHGLFDLSVAGDAERMVEAALQRFGRVDVLVNNAGIRCRKAFGTFTREEFGQLMEVNLAAAFFASQAVLPAMRRQGGGRIIHVASQMGSVASDENTLYGISKAALIHLARCMAYELAPEGILVNSVSPGATATVFNLESYGRQPGRIESIEARIPAGRLGEPDEIAEAIAFLATQAGKYIVGHDLVVDGGYIIH